MAEAAGLEPGTALDLGCGEGADALWLAEQGWTVTAVDVSAVALERAEQHAAASGAGNRITWLQRDLDAWAPEEQFDLVSAQFLHSTEAPWQRPHRVAADAVRPGGTLLVVGHHPDGLPPWRSLSDEDSHAEEQSHSHGGDGHANSGMFFTAEQAAAELGITPPGWHVDVAASRERQATGPDGQSARSPTPSCAPPACTHPPRTTSHQSGVFVQISSAKRPLTRGIWTKTPARRISADAG